MLSRRFGAGIRRVEVGAGKWVRMGRAQLSVCTRRKCSTDLGGHLLVLQWAREGQ